LGNLVLSNKAVNDREVRGILPNTHVHLPTCFYATPRPPSWPLHAYLLGGLNLLRGESLRNDTPPYAPIDTRISRPR
jgi:hypothetical protein